MTVQKCIDGCAASGYTSAGVEYGSECYCGNVSYQPGQSAAQNECSMACLGDASELVPPRPKKCEQIELTLVIGGVEGATEYSCITGGVGRGRFDMAHRPDTVITFSLHVISPF